MSKLQDTSVQYVKGVGPAKAKLFANLGIENIEDLFYFFPRGYEDRRVITPIVQTQVGKAYTLTAKVTKNKARKSWHTKKHVSEIEIDDGTGRLACVWFNQPYVVTYLKEGSTIVVHGKIDLYKEKLQMVAPEYEVIDEDESDDSLKRIVPIYPLTRGMTQRYIRKIIRAAIDRYHAEINDELPIPLRNKLRLANIKRSILSLHFPESFEDQDEALKRVSFEEFYFYQISILLRRLSLTAKKGVAHKISDSEILKFIDGFAFDLTNAQKRVINEINNDMQKSIPMLRLLQGDVGSGKTIVALFGCVNAKCNNSQSAFMAPTEILARQHYENIMKLIDDKVLPKMNVTLLVSGLPAKERSEKLKQIEEGEVDLVVGTHALINADVNFKSLSFVVIDEQHKFGVRQRALLAEKGSNPDILIMTATPIPRTLCITLYGDLDLSILDELPKGRGKIITTLHSHEHASDVYEEVREKVKEGRQAYIVYPIIEESESLDLKAAEDMYKKFKKTILKEFNIGLVHGKQKNKEQQEVMNAFKAGKIDVLVATTVLEVGIDVPNACVMVIEHAERFGLAQLHQLRGRIGRGEYDSHCMLVADANTDDGIKRLQTIVDTVDGFKIAQKDLEIRGPGRFFGRHQHGLNELRVANPATQIDILELARKEALAVTRDDPQLKQKDNQSIKNVVVNRYPNYLANLKAG